MWSRKTRLAIFALATLLSLSGCARTRTREYAMSWETDTDSSRVVLIWEKFPNHYVDLEADGLRDYLDRGAASSVVARFDVTTRLGCLERIQLTSVDGQPEWTHDWGGSGWVNAEHPSPWDTFGCKIPWW